MANSLDEIKIKDSIAKKYEFQKFLFKNNLNTAMPNFLAKRSEDSTNYLGYVRAMEKGEEKSLKNFANIWQEISKMDSCRVILPISEYFIIEDELYLFQSSPKSNKSLKVCLQEKRAQDMLFSTEETLSILLSILDSLCQLHANGIIHGEINPEYIFWHEPKEKAMLLGLGRLKNFRCSTPNILNKGGYSAPEQQNGNLIEQSDLYALGMLGLSLLTGISADDFSVIDGRLDLTHVEADIFMPVFNWLKQAVELNIDDRFKTALEMREKLGDFYEMMMGEELPPITEPPKPDPDPEGNPKYILRLRTKDNLHQILQEGKSGAWRVGKSKESEIKNIEVYNWDRTKVVKGIFDAKLSYREPDEKGNLKLFVVFTNGSLEDVTPPLKWNGMNCVQYEPIRDI